MFTAKAIEHMIIDALLAAEPYMKIAGQIEDPKQFVYLTDDIKSRIQMTTVPVRLSGRKSMLISSFALRNSRKPEPYSGVSTPGICINGSNIKRFLGSSEPSAGNASHLKQSFLPQRFWQRTAKIRPSPPDYSLPISSSIYQRCTTA